MQYIYIFVILIIVELAYFKIADAFRIIDKPNIRSSHTHITRLGGGIIFTIGMWLYATFFGGDYIWFLIGLTLVAALSFIDDLHSLPKIYRLFFHFIAIGLMFYQWDILNIDLWWIIVLAMIVCIGIMNAYNFMDGINGITAGYSISILIPLIIMNYQREFMDINYLYVALMSVIVFAFFNFRTKAKCFAGDVGSFGIAFIILFALGKLMIESNNYWVIVFLTIYGVDSVLTIIHRLLLHENITDAHRKHAYQLMANELRIPHVCVSLIYTGLQILISLGAIAIPLPFKYIYLAVIVIAMAIVYILFMKKYYYLHEAYLKEKNKLIEE